MTPIPTRTEDLRREMRTAVVPVDDAETVDARRKRTVARLREFQVSAGTRREVEVSYRKRLLIAAAVLLFSAGALAAALRPGTARPDRKRHRTGTTIATPHRARRIDHDASRLRHERSMTQPTCAGPAGARTGTALDACARDEERTKRRPPGVRSAPRMPSCKARSRPVEPETTDAQRRCSKPSSLVIRSHRSPRAPK